LIFLLEYSRREGRLVAIRSFATTQRPDAERERLALELDLNRRSVEHEVVILEAANEAALRRTHGRYFPGALDPLDPDSSGRPESTQGTPRPRV
jgi:hypothetical protein